VLLRSSVASRDVVWGRRGKTSVGGAFRASFVSTFSSSAERAEEPERVGRTHPRAQRQLPEKKERKKRERKREERKDERRKKRKPKELLGMVGGKQLERSASERTASRVRDGD
jgi:hypothetical protein